MNWCDIYYHALRIQAYSLLYKNGHYNGDLDIKHLIEMEIMQISKMLAGIKEGE